MKLLTKLQVKTDVVPVAMILQSLNVLSLSTEDLQKRIDEFTDTNPLVEYRTTSYSFDSDVIAEKYGHVHVSLSEHIELQLGLMTNDHELLRIGSIIANSLDNNGYLRETTKDMLRICKCTAVRYKNALALVQSCDPIGVAAFDLSNCLELQLKASDDSYAPLAMEIVKNHLTELAEGKVEIPGVSSIDIEKASKLVKSLNPRPGSKYETGVTNYILPDIKIEEDDSGDLHVSLINQPACPTLYEGYKEYLTAEDESEREYIRNKLAYARSFIYAVKQREQTIYSISSMAVRHQSAYLKSSNQSELKPLTMASVAKNTGYSLSTVSRAVADKYAEYNGRVVSLRSLFTSGGVSNRSREAIVERIREIIDAGEVPVSDREISECLSLEGIAVSRRTVNKYRNLFIKDD